MKHTLLIILLGLTLPAVGQRTCMDLQVVLGEIRAKRRAEAYNDALAKAQNALQPAEKAGCKSIAGSLYNEIGICYQEIQQYDKSDSAFQLALAIRVALKDQRGQANVYQNLMSLKIAQNQLDTADIYGKFAQATFERFKDTLGNARLCNEYSNWYDAQGKIEAALKYNLKGLELAERVKNDTVIAENALNLGNRYYDKEIYDSSSLFFQKAFDYSTRLNRPRLMGQAMNGLGLAAWGLNRLKDSEKHFKTALEIYNLPEDVLEISNTYNNLSLLYRAEGNLEKALEMTDSMHSKTERFFKISQQKRNRLYQNLADAHADKIELIYNMNKKDRFYLMLSTGCMLIIVIMSFLQVLKAQKRRQDLVEKKLIEQQRNIDDMVQNHQQAYMKERLKAEVRTRKNLGQQLHNKLGGHLIALRNRMENLLSLPQEETPLEDKLRVEVSNIGLIHEEARRLSRTIEKSELDTSWLEDLKRFCDIQNNAPNAKPQMQLILNNMVEPLPTRIAETLHSVTMALIGNALKWAKASRLEIQVSNTGNEVSLIVSDDGIGFDAQLVEMREEKGQGLQNVREEVGDIGGELYIDTNKGSEFIISVPLKNELPNYNTD